MTFTWFCSHHLHPLLLFPSWTSAPVQSPFPPGSAGTILSSVSELDYCWCWVWVELYSICPFVVGLPHKCYFPKVQHVLMGQNFLPITFCLSIHPLMYTGGIYLLAVVSDTARAWVYSVCSGPWFQSLWENTQKWNCWRNRYRFIFWGPCILFSTGVAPFAQEFHFLHIFSSTFQWSFDSSYPI
jgi:hypothetical protein